MNQAYAEYLAKNEIDETKYGKNTNHSLRWLKRSFPTLKKNLEKKIENFAQLGGGTVRDVWNNLAQTDICKNFIKTASKNTHSTN